MDYLELFQQLVGKTVASVQPNTEADEGLIITFTDGSSLKFGFSSGEGEIKMTDKEPNATTHRD